MRRIGYPYTFCKSPLSVKQLPRAPPSTQFKTFICHDLVSHGGTMLKKGMSQKLTTASGKEEAYGEQKPDGKKAGGNVVKR